MAVSVSVRRVTEDDWLFVSILLASAFEQTAEARLVEALRAGGHIALELVAEDERGIVAYIAFVKMVAPEGWMALAPVAVRNDRQQRGIGGELVRIGLDEARQAGARAIVVLGDPGYYKRFGFSLEAAQNLTTPYHIDYTLLYPLSPGTAGSSEVLVYAPPFVS